MRVLRFVAGLVAVLFGATIFVWTLYNLLVEMQPAAENRDPIVPLLFSAFLMIVGGYSIQQSLRREPRR